MVKRYLAFDIGCLECGEASKVIGIFKNKEIAEEAAQLESDTQKRNWQGQHSMSVFEIECT